MKHQQWRIKSNMDKDINRAEAITGDSLADNEQQHMGLFVALILLANRRDNS